jgi:hypothetical protein
MVDIAVATYDQGFSALTIVISSSGGSHYAAVSSQNVLRGLPLEIVTHNIGDGTA